MVDLKGQYKSIKEELDLAMAKVIADTAFIKGKYVQEFKENLEDYLGVKHIIPCGNGTDALQLALMAMDYERGSEVITTPFTFVATVEVICLLGLKPKFVDVDPETFNIDVTKLEAAISEKTKCILPVHLFGQACDMTSVMRIADKHSIDVIEDTAQAISAKYNYRGKDVFCGTIGNIGTLSFFPSKNLGCYGDGGAVMTNDDALAHKINLYANHGSLKKYYYETIGINSRLDGLQAAILNTKLKYLDEYVDSRNHAAQVYDSLLEQAPDVIRPARRTDRSHVFHQYTLRIQNKDRDEVQAALKAQGIPTAVYYPEPLYKQGIYQEYVTEEEVFPVTDQLCQQVLSLPMHTELTQEMQEFIVEKLISALRN